jgi:hypothetical protein
MPGETIYRLSWEMVYQGALARYCNASPAFYKNVKQTVPNSQIPDEDWRPIERIGTDPWAQYNQLKKWADADEQFVRNVRLEKAVRIDADWQLVGSA